MVKLSLKKFVSKEFWAKGRSDYKKKKTFFLIVSLPIPLVIGLVAYLLGAKSTTIIAFTSLGMIAAVVPYLALGFLEFRELKKAEDKFPNFLRDIAQSVSAGMPFPQAIDGCSKARYGELSKYIDKLNIWLSWSIPFPEAWKRFTDKLHDSDLIRRINVIILEAFYSGGDIRATLNSLADNVSLLKQMEADKRSMMNSQIMVMYIVFFIFIGVLVSLYQILTPILYVQKLGAFSGVSLQSGAEGGQLTIEYFKNLFFMMAMVESICAGLIAGQISEERIVAGFKHAVIMLSVSIFLFFFFIFPTQLNLEVSTYPPSIARGGEVNMIGQVFYESSPAAGARVTIITPDKETISVYSDNLGEFRVSFEAPIIVGEYEVITTTEFEQESASASNKFSVVE